MHLSLTLLVLELPQWASGYIRLENHNARMNFPDSKFPLTGQRRWEGGLLDTLTLSSAGRLVLPRLSSFSDGVLRIKPVRLRLSVNDLDLCMSWTAIMPTVGQSLELYGHYFFRYLHPCSLVLAFVPLPPSLYVGNRGAPSLVAIAPLILLVASGLVCVLWWILSILLMITGKASSFFSGRCVGLHVFFYGKLIVEIVGERRTAYRREPCFLWRLSVL